MQKEDVLKKLEQLTKAIKEDKVDLNSVQIDYTILAPTNHTGAMIKYLRESKGLTQRALAKRTALTVKELAQYEAEETSLASEVVLRRLADALDVSVTTLINKDGDVVTAVSNVDVDKIIAARNFLINTPAYSKLKQTFMECEDAEFLIYTLGFCAEMIVREGHRNFTGFKQLKEINTILNDRVVSGRLVINNITESLWEDLKSLMPLAINSSHVPLSAFAFLYPNCTLCSMDNKVIGVDNKGSPVFYSPGK